MVEIKRPSPPSRRYRGGGGSSSSSSALKSAGLKVVGFLLLIQLLGLFWTSTKNTGGSNVRLSSEEPAKGMLANLKESKEQRGYLKDMNKQVPPLEAPPIHRRVRQPEENNDMDNNDIDNNKNDNHDDDIDNNNHENDIDNHENDIDNSVWQLPQQKEEAGQFEKDILLKKRGTGPTELGYLVDFAHERANPTFRQSPFAVSPHLHQIQETNQQSTLEACEYVQNRKLLTRCHDGHDGTAWMAYNGASFPRYWCGNEIAPGTSVRIDDANCLSEPVRLFSVQEFPVNGQGMPPITIQSHNEDTSVDNSESITCDIPCRQEKDMPNTGNMSIRYIGGTNWKLHITDDDPYHNIAARVERTLFRRDGYYSTTSWKSSVPRTFYSFDKYNLRNRPMISYDAAQDKASYLLSSYCNAQGSKRHKWYSSIAAYYPTAAVGKCHHNTEAGTSLDTLEERLNIMKQYRFHLAFESMNEKDHLTEITWEAMLSGSLPVVLGAANTKLHLPPNSVIFGGDYNNWDKLSDYLVQVAKNKTAWESYHAWRTDETALRDFEERYEFSKTSPECRICRWAYAKKYGLGWDHSKQVVLENHLPRSLCVNDDDKLAVRPFVESYGGNNDDDRRGSCNAATTTETTVEIGGQQIKRRLLHHDGITDMIFTQINAAVTLRLNIDNLRNSDGASFRDSHTWYMMGTNDEEDEDDNNNDDLLTRAPLISSMTLQDEYTKVTILANWENAKIVSPKQGRIEIDLMEISHVDERRQLRIIFEDMNPLHDKMTEFYPSSFGKLTMMDFMNPLELYHVVES